ncbi:MAG: hypothetical protein JRH01_20790 [Deltaproteobacteria bacterium]|nr:hypothetical protein [Deltaproteobacteria bacterium]MBW2394838.1 hypothetical protein [Deltaproteobacteria bacterium]
MRGLYRLLGRRFTSGLLWPIALYFSAVGRAGRVAQRRYLTRLREAAPELELPEPSFGTCLRHTHEFAVNIFDRMVAWGGELDDIEFLHRGSEHLFSLAEQGKGAILLGSHLGSFDMMRLLAGRHGLAVNVLMYTRHAEQISRFLAQLDPSHPVRVISLDPSSTRTAFEIRQCLERGEFVGILGDRIWPGDTGRQEWIPFLGHPAPFSLRPFLMAGVLGAPLLFSACVRRDAATYEAIVEPIHLGGIVPRRERDAQARKWLEAYVAKLEQGCRQTPYQWFNFYDSWHSDERAA